MSDLYNQLYNASGFYGVLTAFLIGAAGSLHCVGMCGGLTLAVSKTRTDALVYNIGRLLGYLTLVLLFSFLGLSLGSPEVKKHLALWGGIALGLFLLVMGIQAWQGKELQIKITPLEKLYALVFKKSLKLPFGKAFGVGYSSIFLPCALSYGFIIGGLSLGSAWNGALLVFFFWLGTLPAMIIGPVWTRNMVQRLGISSQRALAVIFIVAGVLTVLAKSMAVYKLDLLCFS
ncbi:MAG: sulfite exporter TauE/SafE family protein [Bacteriovoracaceae bacterium]